MNRDSKAKHTVGEWSVADYGHCIAVEVKLDNGQEHTIMTDQFCHAARFNGDAIANARLIAEAPAMYEAIQEFCDRVERGEVRSKRTYSKFKELIKKIEQ